MSSEIKNETIKDTKQAKTSTFAVIRTGGKQYVVTPGTKFSIEKIEGNEGDKVSFDDVLLRGDGDKLEIGQPTLATKVEGIILGQAKTKKVIVFKYKKRKNYRKKQGHRQNVTNIEITTI